MAGKSKTCSVIYSPEILVMVQHFMELFDNGGGGGQRRTARSEDLTNGLTPANSEQNQEAAVAKIKDYFISHTTMNRKSVMSQFFANAAKVKSGNTLEDLETLSKLDVDKFAELCHAPVPFKELDAKDRIDIRSLHRDLAIHFDGKFLLCRTLSPAINGLWLEVVVEDPSGEDTAILRLVNFTSARYSQNAQRYGEEDILGLLPIGSYLVVKNIYGIMSLGPMTGVYILQVTSHNPADVVILSFKKMKELFPGLVWKGPLTCFKLFWETLDPDTGEIVETLKAKGNSAFALNRFTDALRCYDLALDYVIEDCGVDYSTLWSNKAASFLELGCYQRALECSQKVLQRDPSHTKAVFRKVKSLIGLGRGCQVRTFLTNKLAAEPSLADNDVLQTLKRVIPPRNVKPTMKRVLSENFQCSEYIGHIEFRRNSPSHRGVFATRDIAPGDILLMQRTFAEIEKRAPSDPLYTEILHESAKYLGYSELVEIIANKIALSPELGQDIYNLWGGVKFPPLEKSDPQNKLVDVGRISCIVRIHARFCGQNCGDVTPKVALISHSCVDSNVYIHHGPGWCVVRAVRPINKGGELLTQWFNVASSLAYRKGELSKLEMSCNCRLCQRDFQDVAKVRKKFDKLCTRIKAYTSSDFETSRHKVDLALGIVRQLIQLRADAPNLNTILMDKSIQTDLCEALFNRRMYSDFVGLKEKIFRVAETVNHILLAKITAMDLARGHLKLELVEDATKWVKEANSYAFLLMGRPMSAGWPEDFIEEMKNAGMNLNDLLI